MRTDEKVNLLEAQIKKSEQLRLLNDPDSLDFLNWRNDTYLILQQIYGKDSDESSIFNVISYKRGFSGFLDESESTERSNNIRALSGGLDKAQAHLGSLVRTMLIFMPSNNESNIQPEFDALKIICEKFHRAVRVLKSPYQNRDGMHIQDEYDAQYLFRSYLELFYNDIRDEDYVPSQAGGNSRIDFYLPEIATAIELKMASAKLTDRKLGEQLATDVVRYQGQPEYKQLVFFIYDPDGHIKNPTGLIKDITKQSTDNYCVKVFINPVH